MFQSAPTVLITGSSGHLGSALVLTLPSNGHTPIGIDILPSPTTTLLGSITSRSFISSVFSTYPTIRHIIHVAGLHKPHVGSHTKEEFVQTNITGTLILVEEASKLGERIESFIFTSTTSTYGSALSPKPGEPAAWIDESVIPVPKNIYGVTKLAAEDVCFLIHKQTNLPILILRTGRFFPEDDDDEERRTSMMDDNLKVLELMYRRADISDIVLACVCALKKAKEIGWGKYIISAPTPFDRNAETLRRLNSSDEAAELVKEVMPNCDQVFAKKRWKFLDRIDRIYDSSKAMKELDWRPMYTFEQAIEKIARGEEWRSELRRFWHWYHETFFIITPPAII